MPVLGSLMEQEEDLETQAGDEQLASSAEGTHPLEGRLGRHLPRV